jgi:hypothetical protein
MSEEEGDTKTPDPPEVKPLPDLDRITPKHLADLEAKLRKEMADLGVEHAKEKAELRAQIDELNEEREERRKAREEEDKTKGSQSTMVLPPNDIPPQQPNPNPETKGEPRADGKKVPFWKKVW